ncbi:MORC family CW-type zinc finger protein 2-like isoform X3 [Solanum pennellii]|nr:MORC family CW-type zinc finger protein 2-like isoform X3 [Solanum pennellii]XP_015063449.1 MORC family CW-type zinc finger protein 2-like isoform X3 [Solanum pennellii]XP_015063450.1 MORC family CW-type zinc finger protein 2-like isoform X3 [Solanum pennellii]XP_015063451.1 MORC family CW-type zinc finger protein 2-like isoform X3 [Solanum pennellii]XP_015063452.1 MORC family CW-type zinc finger protein 2-like isoform X3 [Solanum pennellii]XP_027770814.1 MORC family CW-type zinc finger pro
MMGDLGVEDELSFEDRFKQYVMVKKDGKIICSTQCLNPPANTPSIWNIKHILRQDKFDFLSELSRCLLRRSPENSHQEKEWHAFLGFLQKYKKVAIGEHERFQFYILPPKEGSPFNYTFACYREREKPSECPVGKASGSTSHVIEDACSPCNEEAVIGAQTCDLTAKVSGRPEKTNVQNISLESNFVHANPSYLKTLGHTHSGWSFGAIAEFVDNSRDAKATKLEISIDIIYSRVVGREIPMLCIIDDGCGMNHQEMLQMVSFGHKQPDADDPNRIGRFGIGFKTGAMKLGKDALVLTQTTNSRSIAFLSQTLNEGKDNLEIPIVSYYRYGQFMELDKQNETLFKHNLKAIKEFSPFDKYFIGQKVGLFSKDGTGTHIYIWNLEEWGPNYSLQWESGITGGSSFHQGDILIRSRRVRARPGQMTQTVPLDYSLRSYLEVIFLDPRIKIYVQKSQVKSRPLARSLNRTVVENGTIMGKPVQLTLGCNQLEWEEANCGIFLYWHGRLIEAYKRVGSMMHNGDRGRGVIGVIDVTNLMAEDNGHVWVHNNKQGFQDCEVYAELEKWLGEKSDKYLDEHVDKVELKPGSGVYKPDNEWVQCDKCRKWRMLSHGFNSKTLPLQWFCYMKPFNGECERSEQEVEPGVITISSKRLGYSSTEDPEEIKRKLSRQAVGTSKNVGENDSSHSMDEDQAKKSPAQKRKRLRRSCRKS